MSSNKIASLFYTIFGHFSVTSQACIHLSAQATCVTYGEWPSQSVKYSQGPVIGLYLELSILPQIPQDPIYFECLQVLSG